MSLLIILCISYLIVAFYFSNKLYHKLNIYYRPLYYQKTPGGPKINVHDLYPEFRLYDKLNYTRTILSFMFITPIRIIIHATLAMVLVFHMRILIKYNKQINTDPKQREKLEWIVRFYTNIFLYVSGVVIIDKDYDCEEVYKKYLGPDYKLDKKDKNYSLITCNHTGFYV